MCCYILTSFINELHVNKPSAPDSKKTSFIFQSFHPHFTYTVYCRSGLGNHYGTLGGPVEAVSAALRPKEKYKAPGKNFTTNPGKIGTGYG